jgi:hypothetical protein
MCLLGRCDEHALLIAYIAVSQVANVIAIGYYILVLVKVLFFLVGLNQAACYQRKGFIYALTSFG